MDFPISGAILPLLGSYPPNYEFVARKPQKVRVLLGSFPVEVRLGC